MGAAENASEHPLAKAVLDFCLGHLSGASSGGGAQQPGARGGGKGGAYQLQTCCSGSSVGSAAEPQLPISFSVTSVGGAPGISSQHGGASSFSTTGSGGGVKEISAAGPSSEGAHAASSNKERHLLTAMLPAAKETQVSYQRMNPIDNGQGLLCIGIGCSFVPVWVLFLAVYSASLHHRKVDAHISNQITDYCLNQHCGNRCDLCVVAPAQHHACRCMLALASPAW